MSVRVTNITPATPDAFVRVTPSNAFDASLVAAQLRTAQQQARQIRAASPAPSYHQQASRGVIRNDPFRVTYHSAS